ncbi:MFS general substrate transporter [Pluteus cervinus]|uniref:MFS general substrate transporter n=1 Tax=Pluteus cervinus TaxID=181527 RepID=A0ACD3AWP7_9AGAR|nr:MFS general substrate transporter [Pluteus cervinus]
MTRGSLDNDGSSDGASVKEKASIELIEKVAPLAVPEDVPSLGLWKSWRQRKYRDPDAVATQPSVFDDPDKLETFRPPPEYENAGRFDPSARWTWREEKALVRKIDCKIMIWVFIMFFSLELDRSNISQANADNFLGNLGLNTNDFNLGNILFRLAFLSAELPSQLISKRVGPDVWIPTQMMLWSTVAFSQFWLSGRGSFLATRFLLGFLQGGFIPDVILYLSYFYNSRELPIRLAFFWVSNYVADMISAFLATGILKMAGLGGKAGWRYLFLLEGLLTFLVGTITWFMMPPGPTQTRAWFRPKGWFTEREEVIMVNRVLRDDPSKSDMHNRQGMTIRMIWRSLKDWRMWPIFSLGLLHMIPVGPPQVYLTLSLRNLGFTTTQTNLLSVPATFLGMCLLVLAAFFSEIIDSRVGATIILQFWALPLLITLYTFTEETSQWAYFAVITLIVGYPYIHPIQVAWASRNSGSVRQRTISASVYNMFVQASVITYSNIYRQDDKAYKRGNRDLIAICSMNIVVYIFTYFFYKTLNKRRDRVWNNMTREEQIEYLQTTKDVGNERLDFRFVY